MKRVIKKYIVSHKENDYKPHLLREGGALALVLIIFALFGLAHLESYIIRTRAPAAVVGSVIVDLANQDRITRGILPLTVNPILVQAAQLKADDMAKRGYFGHVSPDNITPWYWFSVVHYTFTYAGENLAVDFSESADVEKAWMESVGHRNNILNTKFTEIGVATAEGTLNGQPAVFVVQMFGKPSLSATQNKPIATTTLTSISRKPRQTTLAQVLATTSVMSASGGPKITTVKDMFISIEDTTTPRSAAVVSTTKVPTYSNAFSRLFLEPKHMLGALYGMIALLILIALGFIFVGELQKHHAKMVLYGAGLILLMGALAFAYSVYTVSTVVIA